MIDEKKLNDFTKILIWVEELTVLSVKLNELKAVIPDHLRFSIQDKCRGFVIDLNYLINDMFPEDQHDEIAGLMEQRLANMFKDGNAKHN